MKPCGFKNNPPSVVPAEPFGSETRRRDLSTCSSRVAQVESLKAELFTTEAYLKAGHFLAGEPFSRPHVCKPYIS
jgi:hypothetical protein